MSFIHTYAPTFINVPTPTYKEGDERETVRQTGCDSSTQRCSYSRCSNETHLAQIQEINHQWAVSVPSQSPLPDHAHLRKRSRQ